MGIRYEEYNGNEKKNYQYYGAKDADRFPNVISVDSPDTGKPCYLYALTGRNRLDYCKSSSKYPRAVVAFPEMGDEIFPPDRSDHAVGQNTFQTVSDFKAILFVFYGHDDQNAVVLSFLTELPFFSCPQGETLDTFSVKALDCQNEHLCRGLPFQLCEIRI